MAIKLDAAKLSKLAHLVSEFEHFKQEIAQHSDAVEGVNFHDVGGMSLFNDTHMSVEAKAKAAEFIDFLRAEREAKFHEDIKRLSQELGIVTE